MALTLTEDERTELERRVRSRKIRAEDARRAQVILMLAAGESFTAITATVGCYPDYVSRWKQRFEAERVAGLRAKYRGQPATVRTPAMEARILAKTRQRPPDGSTHWSTRKLAKALGVSHVLVARVWRRAHGPRGPIPPDDIRLRRGASRPASIATGAAQGTARSPRLIRPAYAHSARPALFFQFSRS